MTVSGALLRNRAIAKSLLESMASNRIAASADPVEVGQAVAISIRVAHLLGVEILQSVADEFPANIQELLNVPETEIDTDRDAFIREADFISFLELVDIFSDEESACVAPALHRGWQDKTESCRQARRIARQALGYSIGERYRESLLDAVSIQNRLTRVPAPVQLSTGMCRIAFTGLLGLIERLIPAAKADELKPLLDSLRD